MWLFVGLEVNLGIEEHIGEEKEALGWDGEEKWEVCSVQFFDTVLNYRLVLAF